MGAVCPGGDPVVLCQKCQADLDPVIGPGLQFKGPYPDESVELDPAEGDKIAKIAEVLKLNYRCGIRLMSYQPAGPYKRWKTKEQCLDLTMLRGKTVREALQAAGVQNPITIKGMGVDSGKSLVVLMPAALADVKKEMLEEPSFNEALPPWTDTEECQWLCDNVILKPPVPFKGGSHELEPQSADQIQQLSDMLNKYPGQGIRLIGFTGKPGAHNKWKKEDQLVNLSNLRARTLRDALRNSHNVKNPIAVVGRGHADNNGPRIQGSVASEAEVKGEESKEGPAPAEHEDDIYDGQWLRKKNLEDMADIVNGQMKWRHGKLDTWTVKINDETHVITMIDPSDSSKPCSGSLKNGTLTWDDGDVWTPAPTEAKPQDFVTVHNNPAKVRETIDIKSKFIQTLKKGTSVRIVQVDGRRARIISPVKGWLSIRQDNGSMIIDAV
eukprot:gnl/MRDRNA2_/MRDRNA2_24414_c0_seq2.p1 gnl/MRDRNA2_/MRDRNA2_24414_c0~~gnl/MRDRNA2_/MRDRNA2_24414_c0_seq2.p1  ORF type:complete len:439 (+),score=90.84 gnl/MRDRNA2_/MRDRNA2_24414_c0_seq2:80-1396(+)